ncbi:hypothetical protein KFE25_005417 [Diacronema lutheri]|uniref:Uncharacterized protein n=1 Tax=Diacronema lutheri TaxID=2081491 RepID=A0A8J6C8X1_DIALT|nr:hypothetical protein KFE25_005417 [Diacronema lutheri]
MLLISGLRDFAEMVLMDRELVLRKVTAVSIQGGLEPDRTSPFGFVPDTSQNNAYDPIAAKIVYDFCFDNGIRMSVVSRNAVPLLPMQLARSFAMRTESEVMRYLANAQFLGLAGLWQKLCAGQLPARCDKAWYFATFCGVDGAHFERRELGEVDEDADILGHLNGFVKPYDVIAAMTVLPTTSGWFTPMAEVVVCGTAHRLLLRAEHTINVRSVHNLLRETYHSVALLDADTYDVRRASCLSRLLGNRSPQQSRLRLSARANDGLLDDARGVTLGKLRTSRARTSAVAPLPGAQRTLRRSMSTPALSGSACRSSGSPSISSCALATHSSPGMLRGSAYAPLVPPSFGSRALATHSSPVDCESPSAPSVRERAAPQRAFAALCASVGMSATAADRARSSPTLDSGTSVVELLHAERLRSADGTASDELTVKLLAVAIAQAHVRQTAVALRILAAAGAVCACTVAIFLCVSFLPLGGQGASADSDEVAKLQANLVQEKLQDLIISLTLGAGGNLVLLGLHPSAEQRRLVVVAGVFGGVISSGAAVPSVARLLQLLPDAGRQRASCDRPCIIWHALVLSSAVQICANACTCAILLTSTWRKRANPQGLVAMLFKSIALGYAGSALAQGTQCVGHAAGGTFTPATDAERGGAAVRALVSAAPVISFAASSFFAASPRTQRRTKALIAWPGRGSATAIASLAPLLGYASAEGERNAAELHVEARDALRGIVLDEAGLGALDEALAAADALREVTPPAIVSRDLLRALCRPRLVEVARSDEIAETLTRDSTASTAASAAHGGAHESSSTAPTLRRPAAQRDAPARQHTKLLLALARAHTIGAVSLDFYVLLVLASAPLFERLMPALEIFAWRLTGGGQDMIRVLPIGTGEEEASALLAAVDAFHVMHARSDKYLPVEIRRRSARAVETAGMAAVNEEVRALFPAVRDELVAARRMAMADSVTDEDESRSSS